MQTKTEEIKKAVTNRKEKKVKKVKRLSERITKDSLTLSLIREGKFTKKQIFQKVLKTFPGKDKEGKPLTGQRKLDYIDTLEHTNHRRLNTGHLRDKYSVVIVRDDNGVYRLGKKKKTTTKTS